jgi:hypothetical protein
MIATDVSGAANVEAAVGSDAAASGADDEAAVAAAVLAVATVAIPSR